MQAQSLFPEPVTVEGCVASCEYSKRLEFTRALLIGFVITWALIAAMVITLPLIDGWGKLQYGLTAVGLGLLSTIIRKLLHLGPWDARVSPFITILILAAVAGYLKAFHASGWPIWLLSLPPLSILGYILLCGRDFSFLGMAVLGFIACAIAYLAMAAFGTLPWIYMWEASGLAILFHFFVSYDLAMIMKRRQPREVIEGVCDLYRDPLNFFTYGIRVWSHWRRYRFV